jgi:hypothetical protein
MAAENIESGAYSIWDDLPWASDGLGEDTPVDPEALPGLVELVKIIELPELHIDKDWA